MVNRVILIGNLGQDPEIRTLENGTAVARFSLATNESYRDKAGEWQQQTEWHNVICWRALAEKCSTIKKGSTVYVEGKLTTRTWQDQDGATRRTTEIVANYWRSMGPKKEGAEGSFPSAQDEPGYHPLTPAGGGGEASAGGTDDDLPF